MKTHWMLKTNNDPLAATRQFLRSLWQAAGLEGMLLPVYQADGLRVEAALLEDTRQLQQADPFVPVLPANAARLVQQLAEVQPKRRLGAVLRACEMRALAALTARENLALENWLVIGVDCVACFPIQDYEWRVKKAGSPEALTRQVLRNARQGGVLHSRFRAACQMCSKPEAQKVDLCFGLLGLPVKEAILVEAADQDTAERFHLASITAGPALPELIAQHERLLDKLESRRARFRERKTAELPVDHPSTVEELVHFLAACQPCQKCLEACPVFLPQMKSGTIAIEALRSWLVSCAECGMCEQACPQASPLVAVFSRLSRQLKAEVVAA
jgi:formate dehydrogenase subunit beta